MDYPKEFKYLSHLKSYIANCSDVEKLKLVADVLKLSDIDMNTRANDWQPMSTAPKDGTEIIGYWCYRYPDDEQDTRGFMIVWWDSEKSAWESEEGICIYKDGNFTHWKPLPKGPKL